MSPWSLLSRTRPLFSSSFVILPVGWLLLSFSPLGALKFHQVDAGERAPGRSSTSRRLWQLSWLTHSAQPGWRAHLLPWFAVQMETQRWPRGDGEEGKSDSRAPGWARRMRRKNLFCTWQFLSLLRLPGFLEINSHCFPEQSFIYFPSPHRPPHFP